ncbi:MAG TPA: hypothetical protein VNJ01_16125 [Bacteriovoracaceae bacterium]|nr:hypothetical protein [Bacteriovoracaceae bacterium]
MKKILYLSLLVLVGCVPANKPELSPGNGTAPPPFVPHPYIPKEETVDSLVPTYSSRNFDQMIQILSKVTGVHASRAEIRIAVSKVRSQLPLSYDPISYSTFNHISLTSLVVQYCDSFVTDQTDASGSILGIAEADPAWPAKISQALVNRFAITEVSQDPFLQTALNEIAGIMQVNDIITTPYDYRKKVIIGCTLFLASSYFSFD